MGINNIGDVNLLHFKEGLQSIRLLFLGVIKNLTYES